MRISAAKPAKIFRIGDSGQQPGGYARIIGIFPGGEFLPQVLMHQ
jgi:hypothetical protein